MTDERPDPDAVLARVQAQEASAQRGKLRIYFGASAGVGKTWAMLAAARRLQDEGRDVVVGIVETHGRSETAALLTGLEILARKRIEYRGRAIEEFDLDAALARKPALILVDELAHTNAPGARHPKRWQDVEELLAAGIDVHTTLNVQHLESLNDVVGGITGIRVQETLPDAIIDAADEVLLVDIPAEELIKRLQAGKVYLPEQAERAAANFFRKGNLIALREIALRRVADRVEDDVQAYREARAIGAAWKTEAAVLACLGPAPGGEYLLRSAARMATQLNADWHAVYVETPRLQRLPQAERTRILASLQLAEQLSATTAVLSGNDAVAALVDYAREHNISRFVVGRPHARILPWQRPIAQRIARAMPEADVVLVGNPASAARDDGAAARGRERAVQAPEANWNYLWAALVSIAPTLLATPLAGVLELANIAMLFLLAVVIVAVRWGRGPAVLAAVLDVLAFDFFFVPPRLSFAVSDVQYLVVFAVMLAVGLIIGQLTANLRVQARISVQREQRMRALFQLARELSGHLDTAQIVETALGALRNSLHADAILLLPDADDKLVPAQRDAIPSTLDTGIARWAYERARAAGLATDTLPGNAWRYMPLRAPMRVRGVLALRPHNPRMLLIPEQQRLLETFTTLIAIGIERVHYVDVAKDALVRVESERLRNSLLAALSHDLRTPLAALVGLAETLARNTVPAGRDAELAQAIGDEARRMSAFVDNLLDMARLESGEIALRLEWQSIEEVIGSALQSVRATLGERPVRVTLAPGLPLVRFDAVLIERVLANLVENAAKYTPPDSPIEIDARIDDGSLAVAVLDRGPGLPKGRESAIFEKFVRGEPESATRGVGLGLAICRAIIDAHQGTLRASNRSGGGARFAFTLRAEPPPAAELPSPAHG